MRKLIGTHHFMQFTVYVRGTQGPLLGALGLLKDTREACKLCICKFLRFVGMLYLNIYPLMGKLIGTQLILGLVCQCPPET